MASENNKRIAKINISIIWVNTSSPNRGVSALAYSTLYILNNLLKDKNVEYSFSIIGNQSNGKNNIEINSEYITFSSFQHINLYTIKGLIKACLSFRYIKNILLTDYVLDMGEGDSYSDIYGIKRFNHVNSTKKIYNLLCKKQLLLPQTIGPFTNKSVIKKAHKSLKNIDIIMTRDKQSYEYVSSQIPNTKVIELIDVAFFMPYTKKIFSNNKINVGLNISALLWNGGYTKDNQFNLKIDYKNLTHKIIQHFLSQENVQLHIVPHVVSGNYDIENDYAISRQIFEEYNSDKAVLAPFFLDPIDAKNYISGLDFFIGARMHACIAAFSSGVPVFPLAYSRKFNGLFGDTLQYNYFGDLVNESEFEIMKRLSESFSNKEFLFKSIRTSLDTTVKERYQLLQEQLKIFLNV